MVDRTATIMEYKFITTLQVLRNNDCEAEQALNILLGLAQEGMLRKDERPRLSEEQQAEKAEKAEQKERHESAAINWLETNPADPFDPENRATCKTAAELMAAMGIPKPERFRFGFVLRALLDSGRTDWGRVAERDGIVLYGAKQRLLQHRKAV